MVRFPIVVNLIPVLNVNRYQYVHQNLSPNIPMKKDQDRVTRIENNSLKKKWNNSAYFLKELCKTKA